MGIIILSLVIIVVSVYLLAIVTEEYFITSLDQISGKLKLPSNVAGASLMAMGSSAPELAIALLALFNHGGEHSDVGIGTIVGSAVFNILVITGVSAIVRPAQITMRVVVRDIVVYVASIALLLLVTFADGVITLLEAVAFLGLYAVYLIVLFNWDAFAPGTEVDMVDNLEAGVHEEHQNPNLLQRINHAVTKGIGFLMGDARKAYIRTFLVSVVLIAIISWFLVEYAVELANALNIPPVIIALTILAGGTSVPDLISSVVVSRQGRGEMAVANAIGSNVFDILVGLGLPWLLVIIIAVSVVNIGVQDLWGPTIILLITVIILFVFLSTGRQLTRKEGWALVMAYVAFVMWTWIKGSGT
jgi:K+-dependent Na+/Ca+ exchanger-like protein